MIIDGHQHFWELSRGDYNWLTPKLKPLYQDYGPNDLTPFLGAHAIEGTILVQAAPTASETEYLLSLADINSFILGVVGWVDFEANDAIKQIECLSSHSKLVGLRPMIQNISDIDWMLSGDLQPVFKSMSDVGLAFDALTLPIHLPNLRKLCEQQPDLKIVINHGSKPNIAAQEFELWATDIARIAKQTHVYVKLSGLVTEANKNWTVQDLSPYVNHLIDCFGPNRIIWGSDWPVCTLATSYDVWIDTTTTLLSKLNDSERTAILGGNALTFYQLKGRP